MGSALPAPQGEASTQQGPILRPRVPVPSNSKRQNPVVLSTQSKKLKTSAAGEMSMALVVTKVPSDLEIGGKTNYEETKVMYEKLWSECQECFVFEVDTKYEISIEQMKRAPTDWKIR
jgi:hypothetical protein